MSLLREVPRARWGTDMEAKLDATSADDYGGKEPHVIEGTVTKAIYIYFGNRPDVLASAEEKELRALQEACGQ